MESRVDKAAQKVPVGACSYYLSKLNLWQVAIEIPDRISLEILDSA